MSKIRDHLIKAGVRNLKEFGYPKVTQDNILTDAVYSRFFYSMLEQNLGKGHDKDIKALCKEITEGDRMLRASDEPSSGGEA